MDRFPWESQCEYDYRKETGEITADIGKAMRSMEEVVKSGNLDYTKIKEVIDKCHKKVKYMVSPSMYDDAHKYLQEATTAYARAMELLAAKEKDPKGIYKAGRLINEGTCFIKITKSRIFESVEARVKGESGNDTQKH
jgi:hypothetical protein